MRLVTPATKIIIVGSTMHLLSATDEARCVPPHGTLNPGDCVRSEGAIVELRQNADAIEGENGCIEEKNRTTYNQGKSNATDGGEGMGIKSRWCIR
jgi:hypothetical protein